MATSSAALAMMAIVIDAASIAARDVIEIECAAPDDELLLVDWLNALIYEMGERK